MLLAKLSKKLITFLSLRKNPHDFRTYLCNRFGLSQTSYIIRWVYPAWWNYVLYLISFRFNADNNKDTAKSTRYLVRVPNESGIGDQIVTSWSEVYVMAKKYGLTFTHYPFKRSPHCAEIDWESFFGFGAGEVSAQTVLDDRSLKKVYMPPLLLSSQKNNLILSRLIERVYDKNNIVFHLGSGLYLQSDIDHSDIMPEVYRTKYWKARTNLKIESSFHNEYFNIAVHIRRGDVNYLKEEYEFQWQRRWIETSYYANALTDLNNLISCNNVAVHIYSDGVKEELRDLDIFPHTAYHLCEDPRQTFHDMVTADVLIVSTSAFSILAGKISTGIKLIGKGFDRPDFRLFVPRTGDWLVIEPDGYLPGEVKKKLRSFIGNDQCVIPQNNRYQFDKGQYGQ